VGQPCCAVFRGAGQAEYKLSKDSSFSEEKEAKRLFIVLSRTWRLAYAISKSFLVLFFKKEHFLPTAA
jgi:hypothetical protein